MDLIGKKVVVVGLGRTGVALCRFLNAQGARVVVSDQADPITLKPFVQQIKDLEITLELGRHLTPTFEQADLVVLSPGVPHTIAAVESAQKIGVPIMGEMELAYQNIREPVVAVTGTNGKTTTTELIGRILKHSGLKVFVGGNIGNPLMEYVTAGLKADVVVAEVSSFQLDTIIRFKPKVSVLLNISKDHLDRYPDFDAYAKSKYRIFKNQDEKDVAVLNGMDDRIRAVGGRINCRKLFFNAAGPDEMGAVVNGTRIRFHLGGGLQGAVFEETAAQYLDCQNAALVGRHNVENAAAAALAALAAGANMEGAQSALNEFRGLPHRLQYVDAINGIAFFNDSKATNADAVSKALEAQHQPVVLIMGGQDKGCDFNVLKDRVRRHVKKLIVMGEAVENILSALGSVSFHQTAVSMPDAVAKAFAAATRGDVILLSPGCASFDMFSSYRHRGEIFCESVKKLKKDNDRK